MPRPPPGSHPPPRRVPDGVGARLPERTGRPRQRHHELLSDDPDIGLKRSGEWWICNAASTGSSTSSTRQGLSRRRRTGSAGSRTSGAASPAPFAPRFRAGPGGVYLDIPGDVLGQALEASAAADTIWRVVDPAPASCRHRRRSIARWDRARRLAAAADRARQGRGICTGRQRDSGVRGDQRHSIPTDVDGQRAAAGFASTVRRGRTLAGDRPRRRSTAGRRPAELATRPWGIAAMVRRCQVRASRYRGRRSSTATSRSRRRWSATSARCCRRCVSGLPHHPITVPSGVDKRTGRPQNTQRRQVRQRLAENPHPMRFYNALRRHSLCAAGKPGDLCGQRGGQRTGPGPQRHRHGSCRGTGWTREPGA